MTRTVAVDFDGVLHQYVSWEGNPPKGKPVLGSIVGLRKLKEAGFKVIVFTARDNHYVKKWLEFYGMLRHVDGISSTKPPEACVFFDDRAFHVPSNQPNGLVSAVREWMKLPEDVVETSAIRLDDKQTTLPGVKV